MSNKIKIAFIFPSFEIYGAQKISIDYFNQLVCNGYDVTLLSGGKGPLFNKFLAKRTIFFGNKEVPQFKLLRVINEFFNLYKIIKTHNYDLIISIAPFLNRVICLFKLFKIYKNKLVIEDHAFPPISNHDEFKSSILRFFFFKTEFLYKRADKLKVLTSECKDYYKSKLGDKVKILVIPNFVDFNRIDNLINSHKLNNLNNKKKINTFRIVCIARLTSQKNIFFIINAFNKLNDRLKCELIIIGDGPLKNEIKRHVKNLNLTKKIFIKKSSKFNYSILESADVFPIASKWEGLVLTVIEAMYLNVPIVSTDFKAGMNYLIGKKNLRGYISPADDLNVFADKLEYVLRNKKKINIKKKVILAKSFVLKELSLKRNFSKYLEKIILE